MHCSVLGQGLLPSLQAAAAQGLLAPDALLLPSQVKLQGQLVNTAVTPYASGFDVGPVNRYRWHPTLERIEHDRWVLLGMLREPMACQLGTYTTVSQPDLQSVAQGHFTDPPVMMALCRRLPQLQRASAPFELHTVDLQQCTATPGSTSHVPQCSTVSTQLLGSCDALLVWFELHSKRCTAVTTGPSGDFSCMSEGFKRPSSSTGSAANSSLVSCSSIPSTVNINTAVASIGLPCHCFGLGLHYLDSPLAAATPIGSQQQQQQLEPLQQQVSVTTSIQQQLRLCFAVSLSSSCSAGGSGGSGRAYTWSPHGVPLHAMLPRWHFDMIADEARNSAYDTAIR